MAWMHCLFWECENKVLNLVCWFLSEPTCTSVRWPSLESWWLAGTSLYLWFDVEWRQRYCMAASTTLLNLFSGKRGQGDWELGYAFEALPWWQSQGVPERDLVAEKDTFDWVLQQCGLWVTFAYRYHGIHPCVKSSLPLIISLYFHISYCNLCAFIFLV